MKGKAMRKIGKPMTNHRRLPQSRRLIVLMIAISVTGINASRGSVVATSTAAQSTIVLQTTAVPTLTGTFQVVNNGPGNQTNPHINCDIASYTNDDFMGRSTLHYWDFATGIDSVIPGNDIDLLSDVSGGRIAFTEVRQDGDHVIVYDTVSQTSTFIPGVGKSHPAINGNLVAFEDRSFLAGNQVEISTYDLSTGIVTRLTNDALFDRNPSVSPTANAVVWEKCQTDGTGCDIYSAIQTSPGVFTTRALTGAAGEHRFPDTNGQTAVYTSNRGGETDIYFQPIEGGAETQLSIPGNQRDVTISGNLIAFESQVQLVGTTEYDVFVYDLSTGNLYLVTNTPGVDETLSDLSVCNGIGRIVYAVPGAGDFDVYAFTFQVPSSTPNQIDDLIALIQSFNLPDGTENSLITKLQDALAAIGASDTATACDSVTAFINECQAQSGKKLTADQAMQLINSANQIKTDLGCP